MLVIGGGFAGCFAAIKAREAGAEVIMAVKGRTGRSGLTPWANSWFVFNDTRGVTREQYLRQFVLSGEYLNNMDFVDILMAESYDRYLEVSSWGAETGRTHYYQPGTVTRSIEVVGSGDAMRRQAVASGVHMLERVMITSLIKPEDKVVGRGGLPHGERPAVRHPGQGHGHGRRPGVVQAARPGLSLRRRHRRRGRHGVPGGSGDLGQGVQRRASFPFV